MFLAPFVVNHKPSGVTLAAYMPSGHLRRCGVLGGPHRASGGLDEDVLCSELADPRGVASESPRGAWEPAFLTDILGPYFENTFGHFHQHFLKTPNVTLSRAFSCRKQTEFSQPFKKVFTISRNRSLPPRFLKPFNAFSSSPAQTGIFSSCSHSFLAMPRHPPGRRAKHGAETWPRGGF